MNKPSLEIPETFYRYLPWRTDWRKSLLLRRIVFFSAPNKLNDPYESQIHPNLQLLRSLDDRMKYCHQVFDETQGIFKESDRQNFVTEFLNRLHSAPQVEQKKLELIESKVMNDRSGIFSLSGPSHNQTLLWTHYGDNHKGIRVTYDAHKLSDFMESAGISLVKVRYEKDYPQYSPLGKSPSDQFFLRSIFKADCWEYEQEYRFLKSWGVSPNIVTDKMRRLKIPQGIIQEVTLGLQSSKKTCDAVAAFCNSNSIQIFRTKLRPRKFKIDLTPF